MFIRYSLEIGRAVVAVSRQTAKGENDNESDPDELEELLNDFFCRL